MIDLIPSWLSLKAVVKPTGPAPTITMGFLDIGLAGYCFRYFFVFALPSSTPHWSNAFIFQIRLFNMVLFSHVARRFPIVLGEMLSISMLVNRFLFGNIIQDGLATIANINVHDRFVEQ